MRPAFSRPVHRVSNPFEVRCVLVGDPLATRPMAPTISSMHPNLAAAEQRIRQLLAGEVETAPREKIVQVCLLRIGWGVTQAGGYGLLRRTIKVIDAQDDH